MKNTLALIFILTCQISLAQIPELTSQLSNKEQPIQLSKLNIDVKVVGNVATTTYDMVFFNPNYRVMVGSLSMPMNEGREICRYALDIEGKLREGVIVEKVKARQAFEAVVRQKIDPGIVSKTKGNFFKTKIYPLPVNGSRHIVLSFVETLKSMDGKLQYAIPASSKSKIDEFAINVEVVKGQPNGVDIISDFENVSFDRQGDVYKMTFRRDNYVFSNDLKFYIPEFGDSHHQLFTEQVDNKDYFYLHTKTPVLEKRTKKNPKSIAIYWDNSHSATKRDLDKELELLTRYLEGITGQKEVSLISFNYRTEEAITFKIDAEPKELISYIRQLSNDGASRFDDITWTPGYDEILLFTDAINTIGDGVLKQSKVPVYAVSSSSGSNYNLLRQVSSASNGQFINLNRATIGEALMLMKSDNEKLLSITYDDNAIEELYPNAPISVGNTIEVLGILKKEKTKITLNYGNQRKITTSQSFEITNNGSNVPSVARVWATHKIDVLEQQSSKNQKAIMKLARQFNIVTSNASLLVLDRVEDYVTHEILPPVELREQYNELMLQKKKNETPEVVNVDEQNIARIARLKSWYFGPIVPIANDKSIDVEEVELDVEITEEVVIEDIVFDAAPEEELEEVAYEVVERNSAQRRESSAQANKKTGESRKPRSSIKVLSWLPDAPYVTTLRNTNERDFDSLYYVLKQENANRPSFYIQVADLCFEMNKREMAISVLSNAIELDLENPQLLKVVGRRLLQEGATDLAVLIFEEIRDLRPEEPQSHRDLALAYTENLQYQLALDSYNHIMQNTWERFEDIKDVILNELNNLIAKYHTELDTSEIHEQYIEAMPLDVRIVIDWSSNDNDIDLWVIDPNGEKCFYSHPSTKLGGKISRDFTRGYGPEEFSLKSAKRGIYTVYVKYYSESRQTITGPVTIYASLFTHYGTQQQEMKRIALQVVDNKETRQIGQLEFVE